ncbi:MAG: NAD(P)-binding protein [Vicinamibacterales bacterium]
MPTTPDRDLGMYRDISRRDFLDGARIALTGSALHPWFPAAASAQSPTSASTPPRPSYPPALTGLRGTHDGAWEVAHALRDGRTWSEPATDTDGPYDLVVVGGGLSGLAAAFFYRQRVGASARILVLDNHDDFGGHAKRNEFTAAGRTLVGYGGTQAIENRQGWSPAAKDLLRELGVDTDRFFTYVDQDLYTSLGLGQGVFFDKETWGVDRLVRGGQGNPAEGPQPPKGWWRTFAAEAPFSERARRDFIRLHDDTEDYLPDLTLDQKRARLRTTSYATFLRDIARVDAEVVAYFQQRTHSGWGMGADAVPATAGMSWPGFRGMGFPARNGEPYIFHFPDGNASLARLLVRALVPGVAAGSTMEDVVTARFDYSRLDVPASAVRVRLGSTAVHVRHDGDPASASAVVVTYVRDGRTERVTARHSVLACYHSVVPHLAPGLPPAQREALGAGVKTPLVYTNVLLRNWTALQKAGVSHVYGPSTYYALGFLDFPVTMGGHRPSRSPEEPILLHLVRVPCRPGLSRRDQHRAGRADLLATTFEEFERRTRDQLQRTFGASGFDSARDISAITVNRWPHGYADFGDPLTDPVWTRDEDKPWVIARQRWGRVAIANSDAAHEAETHAAIEEGHRAVGELLGAG